MKFINFFKLIYIVISLIPFSAIGQDDEQEEKNWELRGYIKNLQNVSFVKDADNIVTGNLIHNRINFKWYPISSLTASLEMRNRVFYGEQVKLNPFFTSDIVYRQNLLDLDYFLVNDNALVLHTMLDRAYLNWAREKLEIRAGRQRINWGKTLAWNPNDIFNAYNFFDFDYEERPGVDAFKIQYYTGNISYAEFAVAPGKTINQTVAAGRYNLNKWQYDIQFIGGLYYTDWVVGAGWAGNIKDGGFKGEISYFHPRDNLTDTSGVISFTTQLDYSVKGWYLNGSFLYNSSAGRNVNFFSLTETDISAKNLLPLRYAFLLNTVKQLSPLITANISIIYSPVLNSLVLFPGISYSLTESWDMDLIGQSVFAQLNNNYTTLGSTIFYRIKYSF